MVAFLLIHCLKDSTGVSPFKDFTVEKVLEEVPAFVLDKISTAYIQLIGDINGTLEGDELKKS